MEGQRPLTIDDVLDRLVEEYDSKRMREDEFSAKQFADKAHLSLGTAKRWLDEGCSTGRFERRRVHDGKIQWAYRVIED